MLKKYYGCCLWIPNYFLQNSRQGNFGYIIKNLNEDPNADLDVLFKFCLAYWTATLNETFTRTTDPVLSTKSLTDRYKSCNENPWYFIRQINLLYNPNLVQVPAKLYSRHPAQDGQPVSEYLCKAQLYNQMLAFIDGQEKKFDDVNPQNIFAHNLDHGDKIIAEIELERKSPNKDLQDNWNGDNFF